MSEMLDVLTEEGKLTGEIVSRKEAHIKGIWHKSIRVWLVNDKQEVLLQKRALGKTYPGLLDLSCGGHITAGNSSLNTAVLEIKEELGIDVKPEQLKLLGQYKDSYSEEGFSDNSFYDVYMANATYPISSFKIQIEEVAEIKYFKISELINFMKNKPDEIIMADEELDMLIKELSVK
jgi:isopentenyl-diphosphate Delta-isomerase